MELGEPVGGSVSIGGGSVRSTDFPPSDTASSSSSSNAGAVLPSIVVGEGVVGLDTGTGARLGAGAKTLPVGVALLIASSSAIKVSSSLTNVGVVTGLLTGFWVLTGAVGVADVGLLSEVGLLVGLRVGKGDPIVVGELAGDSVGPVVGVLLGLMVGKGNCVVGISDGLEEVGASFPSPVSPGVSVPVGLLGVLSIVGVRYGIAAGENVGAPLTVSMTSGVGRKVGNKPVGLLAFKEGIDV